MLYSKGQWLAVRGKTEERCGVVMASQLLAFMDPDDDTLHAWKVTFTILIMDPPQSSQFTLYGVPEDRVRPIDPVLWWRGDHQLATGVPHAKD